MEVLDSPPSPNGSSDDQTQESSKPNLDAFSPEEEVPTLKSPGNCRTLCCGCALIGVVFRGWGLGAAAAVSFALPLERTGRHELRSTPSERMFPVIAKEVDVFAIPSAQGEVYALHQGVS